MPDIIAHLRDMNPRRRIFGLYSTVFMVIVWSDFLFMRFRIPLFEHNAFLPETGAFLLYLWIILFLDEFVLILQGNNYLSTVVGLVKRASFLVIGVYALAALLLAINGVSTRPVIIKTARIAMVSQPYRGALNYGKVVIDGWDASGGRREIVVASSDEAALYAGQDVEIVLRKGILFLDRVLEIRQDLEKYYGKMLKASPDSQVALRGLVLICAETGRFAEALKWYSIYAEKSGDPDGIGLELGRRMIEAKQYGQAAGFLKEVVQREREYENLYTLGYALAWAGEKLEAEKYLREATELDPADYRAFYSLGYVCRDTNQLEKAQKAWTTVLNLLPHFPEVEKNLREVEQRLAAKGS
ncbi:MAG: hypothetical protein HYS23_08870 [Geobacter sp.]|nr:hypothetical protein [Geobacter sp.]